MSMPMVVLGMPAMFVGPGLTADRIWDVGVSEINIEFVLTSSSKI